MAIPLNVLRSPSAVDDPELIRRATSCYLAAWTVLGIQLLTAVLPFYSGPFMRRGLLMALFSLGAVSALILVRRGRVRTASALLVTGIWLGLVAAVVTGARPVIPYVASAVPIVLAGILLGQVASSAVFVASLVMGLVAWFLPASFSPWNAAQPLPLNGWLVGTLQLTAIWALTVIARLSVRNADRARRLADEARERSDRQRQESEARYRRLSEAAFDGIALLDGPVIVDANRQLAELVGVVHERDLVGRTVTEFLTGASISAFLAHQEAGAEGALELCLTRGDGLERTVECRTRPLPDHDPVRRVCMIRDVSDRHRAEQVARQGERRLQAILEHSSDLIMLLDPQGRSSYASPAARRILGFDIPSGIRPDEHDLIHPDDIQRVQETFRRVVHTRETQVVFYRARHADGSWIHAEAVASAVEDGGTLTGVLTVTRDVSERKRLNDLLLRMAHGVANESGAGFFRTMVEHLAKGLGADRVFIGELVPGRSSVRTLAVYANGRLAENYEYAIHGSPCRDLVTGGGGVRLITSNAARRFPDDEWLSRERVEAYAGQALCAPDGTVLGLLVVLGREPFRSPYWVESVVRIAGLRAAAELDRIRTDRQRAQLEDQLRRAQKLETIGHLAGGIAHDFNNLLTPILGYSDMLLEDVHATDPRRRSLTFIRDAAGKATSLTRQLLAFSRGHVVDLHPLDLNRVIADFHRILRRTIREHIEIVVESSLAHATVVGDESQLEQVLMNLVVNAQDAMPRGGTIRIRTDAVELPVPHPADGEPAPSGSYVLLTVSDTGVGMSPAVRARVFEPFFTTKGVGHGTGLGLATVYGIVKQHRGLADVESDVGKGTTFRLYFPRKPVALAEVVLAAPAVLDGEESIALVEDDPSVRELATMVLGRHGYAVHAYDGPASCLAAASRPDWHADLLLSDVVMPGLNGRELYERLAAKMPGLAVLYMSGYTVDVISAQGILDDGDQLLHKPFTPEGLVSRVRYTLDARTIPAVSPAGG